MEIIQYSEAVSDAARKIYDFQTHKEVPIRTRFDHLNKNNLGGLFAQNIITIAAISGVGKSHVLQQLEQDVFNKELNPMCDEYVLLRCNWEMSAFKLILRKLKVGLRMPISKFLFNQQPTEVNEEIRVLLEQEKNPNIYSAPIPTSARGFYTALTNFLDTHKDKKRVIVTVDHHALVRDEGNKKKAMDDLGEAMNELRNHYPNVLFILISQMNRDIESRTELKYLAPKRSDLYNTDTLFHISDIVIALHNPYKLGHKHYMSIEPQDYPHLLMEMEDPEKKRTKFETRGNIFWHYLKIREIDDLLLKDTLFIEKIL